MGRISGARNKDHADARAELIGAVTQHVLMAGGKPVSLRELAKAADVDAATLRHYFTDRRGLVQAVFESMLPIGQMRRQMALEHTHLPVKDACTLLLAQLSDAWPMLLGGIHAVGFSEGFSDPSLGQAYVSFVLEPTLAVFEEILTFYASKGELHVADARVASLALVSPLVLGLFHQHQLSGQRCRPLDMHAFIRAHVTAFLRGYLP